MNTAIIKSISYVKGEDIVENSRRMPETTAKKLMNNLAKQYEENGYEIFKILKVNESYIQFAAVLVKNNEPVEYHFYSTDFLK